jgi:hypothetical protein
MFVVAGGGFRISGVIRVGQNLEHSSSRPVLFRARGRRRDMHGRSFRQIDRPGRSKHSVLIDGRNGRHRFTPYVNSLWLVLSAIVSTRWPNSLLTSRCDELLGDGRGPLGGGD